MNKQIFIFIPLYNAEPFIEKTIKSVLAQTYGKWRLLIIDDCSSDNSFNIAKKFENIDKRIAVIKNEYNLGTYDNWNKGISYCGDPYFVKLDADDYWDCSFLEKSIKIIDNFPNVGMVFTRLINIDENDQIIKGTDLPLPEFAKNNYFSCVDLVKLGPGKMFKYPILRQGASIIRSKIFKEIGTLKSLKSHDTEFFYRLGGHYDIYYIDELLYYYRVHQGSDSAIIDKEGIRQSLLFEVTDEIICYYYNNNKLTRNEFVSFKNKLKFQIRIHELFVFNNSKIHIYINLVGLFIAHPSAFLYWFLKVLKGKIISNEKRFNKSRFLCCI